METDKLAPFVFEGETMIRVIVRDGQPWFVAADVCRALGLLNAADTVKNLDDDEKGKDDIDTPGVARKSLSFPSPGTAEVLPTLRNTGKYSTAETPGLANKPYDQWGLDEKRVALAQVRAARETWHQAAAAWMWEQVGLPMPPRHLRPGRQPDLL